MYKGNMQDFMNRVIAYMKSNYDQEFTFWRGNVHKKDKQGNWYRSDEIEYTLGHLDGKRGGGEVWYSQVIHDREDLEEQVYDWVNKCLKRIGYVQR